MPYIENLDLQPLSLYFVSQGAEIEVFDRSSTKYLHPQSGIPGKLGTLIPRERCRSHTNTERWLLSAEGICPTIFDVTLTRDDSALGYDNSP